MNRKSKRCSISLLSLIIIILSTIIGTCCASVGGWSKSPISRTSTTTGRVGKTNPFASGIQRAISRTAERRPRQNNRLVASNGDDDEAHKIINAFIDNTEEATEIKQTMKPHLNLKSRPEPETQSVIKAASIAVAAARPLMFWENMVSGAVSRSIAQTAMHPANTMKTIMQSSRGPSKPKLLDLMKPQMFRRLTCGAGANFVLSLPHGAFNFAVLEAIRERMSKVVESVPTLERNKERLGPGLDFISSSIATICCSVVSTPQMMITDVSILSV